jgi:hypothetical protein
MLVVVATEGEATSVATVVTEVVSVERGSKAAQEGWGLGCRELVDLAAERGALVVEAEHRVASEASVAREAPRALV